MPSLIHAALLQVQDLLSGDFIMHSVQAVLTLLMGWWVAETRSMKTQFRKFGEEFVKWRTHMLGIDGRSGMNAEVRRLSRRAYLWDKQLGEHENRLVTLEREAGLPYEHHTYREEEETE